MKSNKGGGGKKFTIIQIANALRANDGVIPRAAEALGTSDQNIRQRIARSPELQALRQKMEEEMRDYARGIIYKGLREGDLDMARWYAARRMKDEGYGTQVAVDFDQGAIEGLAEAIAKGGIPVLLAARAAISPR